MSETLFNCPDCNKEVSKTAKVCPHCGNKKLKKQIADQNWAEMEPKKKYLIYGVVALVIILFFYRPFGGGSEYKNGVGTITHYTADDWDRDAMLRKMGEEVWEFCQDHQEAKKIRLVIVDECKDAKGNLKEYSQTIVFNKEDIKTFLEYKTDRAFNSNCYEFGISMLDWKPCGQSQF